jgi:hypothetical protein
MRRAQELSQRRTHLRVHKEVSILPEVVLAEGAMTYDTVFLFDVDNTLLDNDRIQADLDVHIRVEHGTKARNRYWEIFETIRSQVGYADYLGALDQYRREDTHGGRGAGAVPVGRCLFR